MNKRTVKDDIEEMEQEYEEEKLHYITKKSSWIFFIWGVLNWLYSGCVVLLGYNWIIPKITNLSSITYEQALFLDLFISFLVNINSTEMFLNSSKDTSFIERIAKKTYNTTYYTIILIVMFIIHLFI